MVVVRSLEEVDTVAEKFSEIGYEYLGEFGITGRRYLRKGGDERTHQIHIFQADDWNNIGDVYKRQVVINAMVWPRPVELAVKS